MQIGETRWYTAKMAKMHPIPDSERVELERINGYIMRLGGWSEEEIKTHIDLLAADGIIGKLCVLKHDHEDVPAGERYLRISKKESIQNLEKLFKAQGLSYSHESTVSGLAYRREHGGR